MQQADHQSQSTRTWSASRFSRTVTSLQVHLQQIQDRHQRIIKRYLKHRGVGSRVQFKAQLNTNSPSNQCKNQLINHSRQYEHRWRLRRITYDITPNTMIYCQRYHPFLSRQPSPQSLQTTKIWHILWNSSNNLSVNNTTKVLQEKTTVPWSHFTRDMKGPCPSNNLRISN